MKISQTLEQRINNIHYDTANFRRQYKLITKPTITKRVKMGVKNRGVAPGVASSLETFTTSTRVCREGLLGEMRKLQLMGERRKKQGKFSLDIGVGRKYWTLSFFSGFRLYHSDGDAIEQAMKSWVSSQRTLEQVSVIRIFQSLADLSLGLPYLVACRESPSELRRLRRQKPAGKPTRISKKTLYNTALKKRQHALHSKKEFLALTKEQLFMPTKKEIPGFNSYSPYYIRPSYLNVLGGYLTAAPIVFASVYMGMYTNLTTLFRENALPAKVYRMAAEAAQVINNADISRAVEILEKIWPILMLGESEGINKYGDKQRLLVNTFGQVAYTLRFIESIVKKPFNQYVKLGQIQKGRHHGTGILSLYHRKKVPEVIDNFMSLKPFVTPNIYEPTFKAFMD